jgi:hypothetical protein
MSNLSILDGFDSFIDSVNTALACRGFLEEENRALKIETEQMAIETKKKDEAISTKDEEINRLIESTSSVTRIHTTKIGDIKNELRATTQLVQMKYEVILLSWKSKENHSIDIEFFLKLLQV